MKRLFTFYVLAVLAIGTGPLLAHHGRGNAYDMDNPITLKGTVSRVEWRNPHVVIYMDVKGANGEVVNWGFENGGVSQLAREGYHRNTLKIGQEITAILHPTVDGSPRGIIRRVILEDGEEIMSRERAQILLD